MMFAFSERAEIFAPILLRNPGDGSNSTTIVREPTGSLGR
jgi:hypothetical protein